VRTRAPSGALLAVLAIALATPAGTTASHVSPKKPASAPNCAHFSLAKMARLLHVSELHFSEFAPPVKTPEGSTCLWASTVPGKYSDLLTVSLTATGGPRGHSGAFEFIQAEALARSAAQQPQKPGDYQEFGLVKTRGAKMFYADHITNNTSLPACLKGWTLPTFGPPHCTDDPPWAAISVYSYGALKPRGPTAFVTVGFAAETPGERRPVVFLNRAILSGKIR
jgi:hypothetical protein